MTNYEAFVKALIAAEEAIAENYGVTSLSNADGADLDFYEHYCGIRLMFETLQNAAEQEDDHSYFRAYQKAEARIAKEDALPKRFIEKNRVVDKEEYLPRSYVFGRKKEDGEVPVVTLEEELPF